MMKTRKMTATKAMRMMKSRINFREAILSIRSIKKVRKRVYNIFKIVLGK